MSNTVLDQVNEHRAALGHPPLETADRRELLLVELCAQYGADRWEPGVLESVLDQTANAPLLALLEEGDPDSLHDDLTDPSCSFAEAWREAERRGLLSR